MWSWLAEISLQHAIVLSLKSLDKLNNYFLHCGLESYFICLYFYLQCSLGPLLCFRDMVYQIQAPPSLKNVPFSWKKKIKFLYYFVFEMLLLFSRCIFGHSDHADLSTFLCSEHWTKRKIVVLNIIRKLNHCELKLMLTSWFPYVHKLHDRKKKQLIFFYSSV